jgi:aspartate/methionine/tyrosine aminotransferase
MQPFKLERYFAQYEFKVKYLLSPSDCESLSMQELLALAAPQERALWDGLRLGYTESAGHPRLRTQIASLYRQIDPDHVLVAAPEEAIYLAMRTLLHPGDHAIVLQPAYQSLYEVARSTGCVVTPWNFHRQGRAWRLDLAELQDSLQHNTRLLVINFPHNPTGYLPSEAEQAAILAIAEAHGLAVFSDEMYRLLEYHPADRLPAVCDLYPRAISLSGLSKAYALPGLRMGWLVSQDAGLLAACQAYKDYTTICSSAPGEILAIIALQAGEAILARNLDIIRHNLEAAGRFFQRYAGHFSWLPPQAGSVAFPRWLGQPDIEAFCQVAVEQQGLMIVPGSLFDFPGDHFRLGLGRRDLPQALARLEAYLPGLPESAHSG